MDPSAQLSFSNTSVSSSLHTRIPLSLISDLIPLACAAFFLFYTICKHSIRQIRKRFGSKEDRSNRKRRLFSVFISKSDILEGHEIRIPDEAIEADEQVAADVVYSAPGLELALVPLIEVFVWANSTIIAVNSNEEWLETVGKAALAVTWLYALFLQISKHSPLASLRLFLLYTLLLLRSIFKLVVSLRLAYYHQDILRSLVFAQILDVAAISWILTTVITLPLRAPLDLVIRLEHGDTEDLRPSSPEDTNTILGEIGYSWMTQLMTLARSRPLQSLDVFALSLNNRSEVLSRRFRSVKSQTLTRRLLRASARDIVIDASLKLTAVAAQYCQPFFVQRILEQLVMEYNNPSPSAIPTNSIPFSHREKAYLYTILAFLSMVLKTLAQQRHFHYARRIGMRFRSELTVEVFEKSLRRKTTGGAQSEEEKEEGIEAGASVGKVISLVSVDTDRVLRIGCDAHLVYGAPLEIIIGLALLYNLMGWSAFVGLAVLLLLLPINYYLGGLAGPVAASSLAARDSRQSSIQELFSSIRTIKLAGWSQAFVDRVEVKRKEELKWMYRARILRLALIFIWVLIGALVTILSFSSYVFLQHQVLTVPVAFTALSFFALIQEPLYSVPNYAFKILELRISLKRLQAFLGEKEVESHVRSEQRSVTSKLAFEEATLKYPSSEHAFELQGINVEFPQGKLSIISGPTGSGKTSLLLALLGELDLVSGNVSLPSSVSYSAQQPWLESLTVRDNILFGNVLDESRLRATIKACALEPDLEILPDGDLTFCGERGISLSGGQAARVALARAIYAPSDIVLLDDVFSAVDATTSAHFVEHLFQGPLVANRTIVLITHHIEVVLPIASHHLSIDDGKIVKQRAIKKKERVEAKERLVEEKAMESAIVDAAEKKEPIKGKTAHVEGWTSGEVKTGLYTTYLSASSWLLWIIVIVLLIALPFLEFGERLWLAKWGEAANGLGKSTKYYVFGYTIISSVVIVMIILPQAIAMFASLRASRSLFHRMLVRVVHAPLRWIDIIPMGTLSNRFTNDIGTVDDSLAIDFSSFGHQGTAMFVALLASGFILPSAIVPTLLFALLYGYIFRNYLLLNRDANRIASTTASPLFASFAEALRGVTTIRAYSKESQFRHRLCKIVDETLAFWYLSATLDIWLSFRTQLLAALCLFSTATLAIYSGISPGLAGVAIASSQTVINSLSYLLSSYGRLILDLNALERITEYLEVPQEPVGGVVPSAVWPSSSCEGALVRVEDLVMSYDPALPPVLKGISFDVKPGERIGIVGRTGAGKSTLATALLRFSDPVGGKIVVDGLDITKVSLDDLRKRITYLPQEATLFEGTLRDNIDLFAEHSDDDCLSVLRQVHLLGHPVAENFEEDSATKTTSITLATSVSAGGSNFSAGQRQLIAMARALLHDSRIAIFDESTASLDHKLDDQIQRVIREEFKDAAIITIAHRLRTVRDYDRILVLEAGKIVELDTPDALLERENGVFRKMWNESQGTREEK